MASTSQSTSVYYEDPPPGALKEDEFFCTERIVPRKIKPQNLVIRLMDREIYGSRKPGSHFHVVREFYQNVFPNLTIVNVEKPPCFLRKFSPDGKHFIAFSADQTSLEIYEYRGAAAAGDLVAGYPSDLLNADADAHHRIRTHIFYRFFKPKFTVNVCQQREVMRSERNNVGHMPFMDQQLNRECSLFTEDGRYVIVGSAAHIPDDLRPHFYHIHSNNEAVTPTIRSALEDYSLHLVDLHQGKLCDTKHFRIDKIYLSHNQGIYLYKEVLAVLSVQHQTIHLFQIVEGMLIEIRKIGRFCYDDDPFIVNSVFVPLMNERPFHEETINSLKHRLLVFLFKRAKTISDETGDPLELRKFYKYFDMFKSLRMWKMQLLDEDHLFIKYASEEVVTLRVAEPNSQSSFFVIYNISESKILEVYENTSEGLLQLFENYCDCFRNARLCADSQFTCSPSNNLYARLTQQRFKQTIVRAIYGGRTEATKRILAQLPISAQSYSGSPYLDLGLFSYDDKWVSVMERPKAYGEYPIRFYARDSGLLKFKIYAGVLGQSVPASARRLVAFTFHPTDPFAISVQRTNSEYIVNFHIRNAVFS
uniref:DET1 homolog n=1 Tax=Heliothis virescens TaxID=7102 RepID=A0A2A4JR37_HELVI